MRRGVTTSPQSYSAYSPPRTPYTVHRHRCAVKPLDHSLFSPNLKPGSFGLQKFPIINLVRCKSTGDSGQLNGKCMLEEEQLEMKEEVLEKARQAKEQAAREAMEARGLIPKSTAAEVSAVNGVASDFASSQASSLDPKRTIHDPPNED